MKLSVSTWCLEKRFGYEKAFEMIKNAGFDAIDYNLDDWIGTEEGLVASPNYQMSEDELWAYYTKMYEYAQSIGLEIGQTHGRIRGLKDFKKPRGMVCTLKDSF
jgi:hypothetical protein